MVTTDHATIFYGHCGCPIAYLSGSPDNPLGFGRFTRRLLDRGYTTQSMPAAEARRLVSYCRCSQPVEVER